MSRPFTPKILTANHLLEGDVIYLASRGEWTRELRAAWLIIDEKEANAALESAQRQQDEIVEPYLADAVADAGKRPSPSHFREAFRARGPSNYKHGKQEHY